VKLVPLTNKALAKVLQRVIDKEKLTVSEDVLAEIVEASEGSARKALVILEQVALLEGDEDRIAAIQSTTVNKDAAIDLARKLISGARWPEVASTLKQLTNQEPEGIRHLVLAYARNVMLSGGKSAARAYCIIDTFSDNFFDSKQAGLAAACWEIIHN
jgi:DNA polymerase III gamma/tau subunit